MKAGDETFPDGAEGTQYLLQYHCPNGRANSKAGRMIEAGGKNFSCPIKSSRDADLETANDASTAVLDARTEGLNL